MTEQPGFAAPTLSSPTASSGSPSMPAPAPPPPPASIEPAVEPPAGPLDPPAPHTVPSSSAATPAPTVPLVPPAQPADVPLTQTAPMAPPSPEAATTLPEPADVEERLPVDEPTADAIDIETETGTETGTEAVTDAAPADPMAPLVGPIVSDLPATPPLSEAFAPPATAEPASDEAIVVDLAPPVMSGPVDVDLPAPAPGADAVVTEQTAVDPAEVAEVETVAVPSEPVALAVDEPDQDELAPFDTAAEIDDAAVEAATVEIDPPAPAPDDVEMVAVDADDVVPVDDVEMFVTSDEAMDAVPAPPAADATDAPASLPPLPESPTAAPTFAAPTAASPDASIAPPSPAVPAVLAAPDGAPDDTAMSSPPAPPVVAPMRAPASAAEQSLSAPTSPSIPSAVAPPVPAAELLDAHASADEAAAPTLDDAAPPTLDDAAPSSLDEDAPAVLDDLAVPSLDAPTPDAPAAPSLDAPLVPTLEVPATPATMLAPPPSEWSPPAKTSGKQRRTPSPGVKQIGTAILLGALGIGGLFASQRMAGNDGPSVVPAPTTPVDVDEPVEVPAAPEAETDASSGVAIIDDTTDLVAEINDNSEELEALELLDLGTDTAFVAAPDAVVVAADEIAAGAASVSDAQSYSFSWSYPAGTSITAWIDASTGDFQMTTAANHVLRSVDGLLYEQAAPGGQWSLSPLQEFADRAFVGRDQLITTPSMLPDEMLAFATLSEIGEDGFGTYLIDDVAFHRDNPQLRADWLTIWGFDSSVVAAESPDHGGVLPDAAAPGQILVHTEGGLDSVVTTATVSTSDGTSTYVLLEASRDERAIAVPDVG
ncbi:MAG: hypothetical protein HKN44_14745 [Ilumatobacter sp.]|nr:hypothetical protein [Ilumatobacter sp.]